MNDTQFDYKSDKILATPQNTYTQCILNDFSIIDQYLSLENNSFISEPCIEGQMINAQANKEEPKEAYEGTHKKSKSIFHNFQKHLITLIKKFIHFQKNKLIQEQSGAIAYSLWQNFMEKGSNNKKILNLVFGAAEMSNSQLQSQKLSEEFSGFKKIFSKHRYSSICEAQQLLRQRVLSQASTLSKNFLRSNSNVGRFQEFYLYFQAFLQELEQGPLTRRMTKSCKRKLIMQNQMI